jgi:hypothetical protein
VRPRERREVGRGGVEVEGVRAAGVDAAEQRVDETFDDLAAEAPADQVADRDGLGHRLPGQPRLDGRAQEPGRREDAGPGERPQPGRDAADGPGRERAEPVPHPDPRLAGGGGDEVDADGLGEPRGVGDAGQPVVGAGLDGGAAQLAGEQLAAEPFGLLDDRDADGREGGADGVGGGEAADAAADDDDMAVGPGGVHES